MAGGARAERAAWGPASVSGAALALAGLLWLLPGRVPGAGCAVAAEPTQAVTPDRTSAAATPAGSEAQPPGAPPAPGEPAPVFSLPGRDGASVTLEGRYGKFLYLDFWASWCPACQQSFPWMNALQQKFGPQGLEVVAIGVDTRPADAEAFLAEHPAGFTVAFDSSNHVVRKYGIRAMPTSLLIGPDGTVRLLHEGYTPADQRALEQAIRHALGRP